MMRCPRVRLDMVYPALDNRVLDKETTQWEHHDVALPLCELYAGDVVWVVNYAGIPKWLPGIFQTKLSHVSFTVGLTDGRV